MTHRPFLHLAVLLVAMPLTLVTVQAQDLANATNIYAFSKPFQASDMVLENLRGGRVALSDLRGKVVLVHFWKIQCPACRVEEPLLEWLRKSYGPYGLEILGVNLSDSPKSIATHAVGRGFGFPVLFDKAGAFRFESVSFSGKTAAFVVNPAREAIFEVPGLPTTYVVDCSGKLVARSVGPARWNSAEAVAFIQKLVTDRRNCMIANGFGKLY